MVLAVPRYQQLSIPRFPLVLHEYLQKYPSPEEAAKHTSDAVVSSQYFEEAVKKIKKQRETRPGEPIASMATYR